MRPAEGEQLLRDGRHLPGEEVWLVGERRASGERKYSLTNHAAATALPTLVAAIKARWVGEQAHQQPKTELGLDHFQGRSWVGLHHHALLTMMAFAFLQHLRLRESARGGPRSPTDPPPHPTLPAVRRTLAHLVGKPRACPRCAAFRRTRPRRRSPPEVAK